MKGFFKKSVDLKKKTSNKNNSGSKCISLIKWHLVTLYAESSGQGGMYSGDISEKLEICDLLEHMNIIKVYDLFVCLRGNP